MTKPRPNLFESFKKEGWNAFDSYRVTIQVKNFCGGKPATADLIEKWVNTMNKEKSEDERRAIIEAHMTNIEQIADETVAQQATCFARMPPGPHDGELA